jgi:hypothetical protein
VEVRNNDKDILDVLSKLNDLQTLICCAAERAYLCRLVSFMLLYSEGLATTLVELHARLQVTPCHVVVTFHSAAFK